MKLLLSVVAVGVVTVLWLSLKYWQAKKLYTRDLGNGGIQDLFKKRFK